jgi:hypothetical protein
MSESAKNDSVQELTQKAVSHIKPEMEQVVDVQGVPVKKGIKITATKSNKEYFIRPCSLKEIPELVGYVKDIEGIFENKELQPTDILIASDNKVLNSMANMILMGIREDSPNMTIEKIREEFTLGNFPAVYKVVLDINDFLVGMRKVYQL